MHFIFMFKVPSPYPSKSFPNLQIKTLKLWCSTCITLSLTTKNYSIPRKRNLSLWCHEIVATRTHKSPTLKIVSFLSCNSITKGLNKDNKEKVFGMLLGNYCPTSNSITSFQPNLNFWVKVEMRYMIARLPTHVWFGSSPTMCTNLNPCSRMMTL